MTFVLRISLVYYVIKTNLVRSRGRGNKSSRTANLISFEDSNTENEPETSRSKVGRKPRVRQTRKNVCFQVSFELFSVFGFCVRVWFWGKHFLSNNLGWFLRTEPLYHVFSGSSYTFSIWITKLELYLGRT